MALTGRASPLAGCEKVGQRLLGYLGPELSQVMIKVEVGISLRSVLDICPNMA